MRYNENDGEEVNGIIVITSEIDDNPIFETSCVVVGDITAEHIRANFDLTVVGNVKGKKIEVAGKFVCLGNCECDEIAVQGASTIDGNLNIECGLIGETLLAKDICAESLEAKGSILCSNLECNDEVICEEFALIAEGLTGAGSLASKMSLCGEYSMLDDTNGVFIADTLEMQKPNVQVQEVHKASVDLPAWKQMAINMKPAVFYNELCKLVEKNEKYKAEAQAFHKLMLVENITILPSIKTYVDIMDIVNKPYKIISNSKLYGKVKAKFESFDVDDVGGAKLQSMTQKDFAKIMYILSISPQIFNNDIRELLLETLFLYLDLDYDSVIEKFSEKNSTELDELVAIEVTNISSDISVGDTVNVVSGVWKNTVGDVIKIDETKHSVFIDVELFGIKTPVNIPLKDCKKV